MIRGWLKTQNRKYDLVKEPNRIFLLIGITMPGIIMCAAASNLVASAGMVYLLILLAIRALYIHGKL